ncbi:MAG: enoyl-CoA hydratase/isomerase family protein [Synergistales bacterium]|nr:enoyl-CoA hydratase/isomerase family protein [Synergistales bacterium]
MPEQEILTQRSEHVGYITLNRPKAMNTFTPSFALALDRALREFDEDRDIRAVVVKAAGKHFSTGIDLKAFNGKSHGEIRELIRLMDLHNHRIPAMTTPVIASVQGYALANGAGLCCTTDFVVAAEGAAFGTTAINVGLICLEPGIQLMRTVGRKKALEMVLTGRMIPAEEARDLGIVNEVVPAEQLEEATEDFARKLAAKSPLAIAAGKRGLYATENMPLDQAIEYAGELFAGLAATEDAGEGIAAFLEKRTPQWKGE